MTPLPQDSTEEPETNPTVPLQDKQRDARESKDMADYDLDVDYEPEGSEPDIKAVNEEEENSDTEYAKMELS